MRKITFLLTLLLLGLCGSTQSASAAVDWGLSASSLTSITAGQTVVIKECPRSLTGWSQNSYMNSGSGEVVPNVDYSCLYRFVENGTINQGGTDYTVYVLYNVANGKYLNGNSSYTANKDDALQLVASHAENATNEEISGSSDWVFYHNKTHLDISGQTEQLWTLCKKNEKSWLNVVYNPGVMGYSDTNLWLIYSVDETKIPDASLAAAKENACAKIDVLAPLTTLYTDIASVKSQINAVTVAGNDINAALTEINTLTNNYISSINNKSIIFTNQATGTRAGLHITVGTADGTTDMTKAYGTTLTDKNRTIWTIKDNGDGTFKLFNVFYGQYLGTASSEGMLSANAADGANFTFVIRGENIVSLKDQQGNIFHQKNASPFGYMAYNNDDAASNWVIEAFNAPTAEVYANYLANKPKLLSLAYSYFYENYCLVKDASKMSVVVIETENSGDAKPVSNLIDGNTATYVHSSYGSDKGTDPHYIQVELSEAQQHIMFYMAKRNGNNRPATIKVYVSNDGESFGTDPVATLENLHQLGDPYYSPKIDLGASYKFVRFVVTSTSSNTQFFTASEFYVLPINDETQMLLDTYAVTDVTGITTELVDAQNAVITAKSKSEYRAILAACSHAEVPALGEYTTAAYNAMQTAVEDDAITLDALNAVIEQFNRAQNRPVFIFTSANDGDYSNNSSMYDNNGTAWKWATKNYYDKSMLFSVKDLTTTELSVGTAYNMYNYVTARSLFYDGTVTPEAVTGKEGVLNLKVNTGNGYLHCQQADSTLVTWFACAPNNNGTYDNLASSWRIEYVGNTYDLDQITDFPVAANELMAINTAMKNSFGTGLNKFSAVNPEQLNQAIASVEALQARENARRYSVTNTEATAAVAALNSAVEGATMNQPATGKFYRLKNVASGKYLTSTITNSKMTMGEAGNTRESVFCLVEGNKLLSYENGLMAQNFTSGNYGFEAADAEGHTVAFVPGNPLTAGNPCYHIQCGERFIYGNFNNLDAGKDVAEDNPDTGYDWMIEEVQWLPVAVSSTVKYGTLYAPVDLSLREGLEAFTGTINGEWLHLDPVTGVIPAGTAVVLKDTGAQRDEVTNCIYLELASGATAVGENALAGTFKTTATVAGAYTLQNPADGLGFYPYNGETLAGFKAYMPNGTGVRGFKFQEGETTLIEGVEDNAGLDEPVYDLSGRRVQNARKGIYIIGGKKVIVK